TDEPYSNRRSVYGYVDRGRLPELMSQFDFADPDRANSRRTTTIVPQQALFFMNSPMSADVARKVTSRPEFLNARDDYARVDAIYEGLFQRQPRTQEVQLAATFYNLHPPSERTNPLSETDEDPARPLRGQRAKPPPARAGPKQAIQNEGEMVGRQRLN